MRLGCFSARLLGSARRCIKHRTLFFFFLRGSFRLSVSYCFAASPCLKASHAGASATCTCYLYTLLLSSTLPFFISPPSSLPTLSISICAKTPIFDFCFLVPCDWPRIETATFFEFFFFVCVLLSSSFASHFLFILLPFSFFFFLQEDFLLRVFR